MLQNELDSAQQSGSRWERMRFTGKGGEYFRIWIVNIFLSILTLGIYSAWAKVRTNRYFYGNTRLDGAAFEYHATPMMILKGRLIAVAVLLLILFLGTFSVVAEVVSFVILGLLTPFVIWRSTVFSAKMSSYRNVRFGFTKGPGPLYRYLLLLPLLPLLVAAGTIATMFYTGALDWSVLNEESASGVAPPGMNSLMTIVGLAFLAMYLLFPYIQKSITAYHLNGHRFGQGVFRARLSAGKYYLIYLTVVGVSVLVYVAVLALIVGAVFFVRNSLPEVAARLQSGASPVLAATVLPFVIIPVIMIGLWIKAWLVSRVRNYALSKVRLESALSLRSRIKANRLFWIQFTNLLVLVITLGIAYPWTVVRLARYKTETLYAHIHGDLDEYVTQMQNRQSALGEELGEAFDLDLDLGI